MSIEFLCQVCGRELKADERAIGRKVRCPDCATLLVIPDPAEYEQEQQADEAVVEESKPETLRQTTKPPSPDEPRQSHAQQPEVDLGETAPMELEDMQSSSPPPGTSPQPPAPGKKRRREKSRQRPAEVEPQPEGVAFAAAPPPPRTPPWPSFAAGAAGVPPAKPHSIYDDAPLLPKRPPHPEDLIDMTAMVDIVFFLLIFFLVTSLQSLEAVMNLPRPQSSEPGVSTGKSVTELENDPNYINVRIEDDDSIWVENTQVFNDQELSLKLRAARQESDGPRSLLVVADADASHGTAVRVFDAGAGAGVSGISLVVQEKSEGTR
jgi:biopolymer transport protein ExbD